MTNSEHFKVISTNMDQWWFERAYLRTEFEPNFLRLYIMSSYVDINLNFDETYCGLLCEGRIVHGQSNIPMRASTGRESYATKS